MEINKSKSTNIDDYEIMIRKRGNDNYASYCPQINLIIRGTQHEQVQHSMLEKINEHIEKLKILQSQNFVQ